MKSIQLLFLLSVCCCTPCANVFSQNWSVGLHFGENFTTLTGGKQYDYRLGFMAGVHVSHYLTEHVVMRLEVNMERKGAQLEQTAPEPFPGEPEFGNDFRLDYLSLPLLIRYSTGNKSRIFAGGGVSVDYLVAEKTDYNQVSIRETAYFRRFDTNLIACLGGALPLNKKLTASFEIRGLWGLVKVDRPEGIARDLGRNLSWGLMAGLNYYL